MIEQSTAEKPASTALTVQERAAVALGSSEREKKLIELVTQAKEITVITNAAGYQQCHATRMALKRSRIEIENIGETARKDARDFAAGVIAEERRLIAIPEPEEKRLQALQDAHDAKAEAEKQAKIQAEKDRLAKIQAAIDEIKGQVADCVGKSALYIGHVITSLESSPIDERFGEFKDIGEEAKVATMAKLRTMHAAAVEQEAEAAKIKADREQLEREKAAEEERRAEENRKFQAEMAASREAERIRTDALAKEEREHKARVQAEEDAAKYKREESERIARAERDEQERADRDRRQQEDMARSEIMGLQQQVIIAQIGRAGVRAGGTIQCIKDTLAETEKWELEEKRFGIFYGAAMKAKEDAIAQIRDLLEAARIRDDQDRQRAAEIERLERERTAKEDRERKAREAKEAKERLKREREEAEAKAKRDADEAAAREVERQRIESLDALAMLSTFREKYGHVERFADVVQAIDKCLIENVKVGHGG